MFLYISVDLKEEDESNGSTDTREKVDFKVIFNKQKYDVTFPIDETVAKLKSHIQTLTGKEKYDGVSQFYNVNGQSLCPNK